MPSSLPLVTLYLSERCNSRCITCDFWQHGVRDMRLEDVRAMLPELEALGTRSILISGGEPLLNAEWQEIAALLQSAGFGLWLLTSGLSLAKHAAAVARLFGSVTVSLDGSCAETYAAIRGVDAFGKVCEGIRATAAAGIPTGIRVTLQRANFRELASFVTLAKDLGAHQVSFLAIDVGNPHAFARNDDFPLDLAPDPDELEELSHLIDSLELSHREAFRTQFIAESPAKLRRIRDYFAALLGLCEFPPVRCNAPEFSAVVSAGGRVSPCFFIAGPRLAPQAPALRASLNCSESQSLRASIRAGERPECRKCVCSMWRDPDEVRANPFRLRETDAV